MAESARRARVTLLVEAARVLGNPQTDAGRALRRRLLETTGLSAPNIELGLTRCLETEPVEQHLQALLASTPEAPHAHVLLSGNVFVAALRAIAIGLASSAQVSVRASRRDPALAEALQTLAPELFELTTQLAPKPGDHLWSYGSDATLAQVKATLPTGVWFHHHGSGFGAAVVDASALTAAQTRDLALDSALFDQRGCLSPRIVCVIGSHEQVLNVARSLASELTALERELPPGPPGAEQAAEARRHRDAAAYAFELFNAGSGWVSLAPELVVPPAGRNLHVSASPDPLRALTPFVPHITCIGTNADRLASQLRLTFGGARLVALGDMQRPPLDGPVDRRHGTLGVLVQHRP